MRVENALPLSKGLGFYARQAVEGFMAGRHRSPLHGFSVEFSDYRQYNTGESTRNIDWHLYGRTDKLFVKQFDAETNLRCQVMIDQSSSMLFPVEGHCDIEHPDKITFAAYGAAVLFELLHRQRDAFGLTLFSDGTEDATPCRTSATHQRYLLALLDNMLQQGGDANRQQRTTSLPEALHRAAEQLHRRTLVVLFTDALVHPDQREPLFDAMRHMRHNKHEVILFHTYDKAHEVDLDYGSRPHRFVDLESGSVLRLYPNEAAEAYSRQMVAQFAELQQRAMQYHIDYVPVDVAQGFAPVMLPFLLKRSKM